MQYSIHQYNRITTPLCARYHPLPMYLMAVMVRFLGGHALQGLGFEHKVVLTAGSEVRYWIRRASGGASNQRRPLCFLHGVGVGQATSAAAMPVILEEFGYESTIVLPEYDAISMVPGAVPPTSEAMVAAIGLMLDDAWEGAGDPTTMTAARDATFISHSWGSIQLSWLLKKTPERVGAALFLDPIVFLLHLPNVCYSFAYRTAWWWAPSVLKQYIVASELGLANAIHRHFIWHENALYLEDLPSRLVDEGQVRVVMGSEDSLVPADKVHEYLTQWDESLKVKTLLVPGFDHVQWAASRGAIQEVLQMLRVMHQNGGGRHHHRAEASGREDENDVDETCLLLGAAVSSVSGLSSPAAPRRGALHPRTPARRAG